MKIKNIHFVREIIISELHFGQQLAVFIQSFHITLEDSITLIATSAQRTGFSLGMHLI